MAVVLIIGILVSIAAPVFESQVTLARAKSCQANQRTILGAVALARTDAHDMSGATVGMLTDRGSGWHAILVPDWIRSTPRCPMGDNPYYASDAGENMSDRGITSCNVGYWLQL